MLTRGAALVVILIAFIAFFIFDGITSRYTIHQQIVKGSNPPTMMYNVYRQGRDGPLISFNNKEEATAWVKAAELAEKGN